MQPFPSGSARLPKQQKAEQTLGTAPAACQAGGVPGWGRSGTRSVEGPAPLLSQDGSASSAPTLAPWREEDAWTRLYVPKELCWEAAGVSAFWDKMQPLP